MLDLPAVEPCLVRDWLAARSLARGLPPPVDDHGGWRVDTGQALEAQRHVFAEVTEGLRQLGRSVTSPLVVLKLNGSAQTMRGALPERWSVRQGGWFMTFEGDPVISVPVIPAAYEMDISVEGAVITARAFAKGGVLAASGHAASVNGVFVYDRILTENAHRRRGLGSAIMQALGSRRPPAGGRQALVATREGQALYLRLGWTIRSPWTTASLVAGGQA